MKFFQKYKYIIIAAVAVSLIAGMSLPSAIAYFTTNVYAEGSYPVSFTPDTKVKEKVKNMAKHITVENTEKTKCYVRVKVYSSSTHPLKVSGSGWTNSSDGYWYYNEILAGNTETATELVADFSDIPEDCTDSFNIIVVQECTPVLYHDDGTPYADWTRDVKTKKDMGTATVNKEVSGS